MNRLIEEWKKKLEKKEMELAERRMKNRCEKRVVVKRKTVVREVKRDDELIYTDEVQKRITVQVQTQWCENMLILVQNKHSRLEKLAENVLQLDRAVQLLQSETITMGIRFQRIRNLTPLSSQCSFLNLSKIVEQFRTKYDIWMRHYGRLQVSIDTLKRKQQELHELLVDGERSRELNLALLNDDRWGMRLREMIDISGIIGNHIELLYQFHSECLCNFGNCASDHAMLQQLHSLL